MKSYIGAIDNKNIEKLKSLINIENNKLKKEIDVVLEIFYQNLLNRERLNFIVENCSEYLNVSSNFIRILIKENNTALFDVIFSHFKFFDNKFILNLLIHYKNQIPINIKELTRIENYKITKKNGNYLLKMYYFYFLLC